MNLSDVVSNRTNIADRSEENIAALSNGGKEALIVLCLAITFLSIISIASHYCNFNRGTAYKKLTKEIKENELVDVDLYESEEEETTSKISM